jgi:mannose-6-phosphate isomerase-like protein (cupin superfamily)
METKSAFDTPAPVTRYADVADFVTKDGSVIRELLHPGHHAVRSMSFAEAVVAAGETTQLHCHRLSEEIYHITRGSGRMRLGDREFAVATGDSVVIAPGTPHCITATGSTPLHILCACHPPYSHEDTHLL